MLIVGHIDIEKYRSITDDITTDEVVITDEQIQHIQEHHPGDFERFSDAFADAVGEPDYVLNGNRPNTAVILKEYDGEKLQVVLHLCTATDPEGFRNSIITFMRMGEKRWNRYLRTKEILYKRT